MPLFELIRVEDKDQRAISLNSFTGRTGPLESTVAVLYMESFVRDPDLCTGADCDNLGKDAVNTPRVLLVDRRSAVGLRPPFDTPDLAGRDLDSVSAVRPVMTPDVDTPATISTAYVTACALTLGPLTAALARSSRAVPHSSAASSRPIRRRRGRASSTGFRRSSRQRHGASSTTIDFLLDLVDTYTDFRMLMFGDTAICAPDFGGFPEHLLLGVLTRARDASALRTPFTRRRPWRRARIAAGTCGSSRGSSTP